MRLDDAGTAPAREALPALDALVGFLEDNRPALTARSSAAELDRAVMLVNLMGNWWTGGGDARSRHMGETLARLLEREGLATRAVFWAHNFHIGVETFPDREPTAGHVLRQRYGDAYYALALEFGEGAYQTRDVTPDCNLGDLREGSIGPPQPGSLPGEPARVGREPFLVDLRAAPGNGPVAAWLRVPRTEHAGTGWVYGDDPEGSYEPVTVGAQYDGVVFVGRSTPTRPPAAARRVAARGEGL